MNRHRIYSVLNLFLIVLYGVFKLWMLIVYHKFVLWLASVFQINLSNVLEWLNSFSVENGNHENILGWFIYYPTYLLLHLSFIYLLFRKQKNVRNILSISLIVLVFFLVLVSIIGKLLELDFIYKTFYYSFRQLFGLPFILLAIEGGKILYNDIKKLTEK